MRVGIIGSGNIASQMAATINQVDGVELYAVASRTEPKAKDFAEKFGASCYYGNYEDLANDKNDELESFLIDSLLPPLNVEGSKAATLQRVHELRCDK